MSPTEKPMALIALLGRRDEPTDGVEDYCGCLREALGRRGVQIDLVRVPWAELGWLAALRWLWRESAKWDGRWVLLQYTALGWSLRGFPLGLLCVLFLLSHRNLPIAVVFHDAAPYPGTRSVDRLRRVTQKFVMRRTAARADRVIVPIRMEQLTWLKCQPSKVAFVPVGSNIPASSGTSNGKGDRRTDHAEIKTVAVFGITPGAPGQREMTDIREVMEVAAKRAAPVQLCAFGRGTKEAEPALRSVFETTGIPISVLGLLPAAQIGEILSRADVQIDVRSRISSRRGSVIAGIVCGTPVVGFESPDTDDIIRGTGVVLVRSGDIDGLKAAVTRILSDDSFRKELRLRNQLTGQKYFSWDAISGQLLRTLRGDADHIPLS